jgi:hypothetical protein
MKTHLIRAVAPCILLVTGMLLATGCGRAVTRDLGSSPSTELPREKIPDRSILPSEETQHNRCWSAWINEVQHAVQFAQSAPSPHARSAIQASAHPPSQYRLQKILRILSLDQKGNLGHPNLKCLMQSTDLDRSRPGVKVADISASGFWYLVEPILISAGIEKNAAGELANWTGTTELVTFPTRSGVGIQVSQNDVPNAYSSAGGLAWHSQVTAFDERINIYENAITIERTEINRGELSPFDARIMAVYVRF